MSLPPSDIGGEAFDFVPPWNFPTVDATTLTSFSSRTCNGCHQFINTDPTEPTEPNGPFFHVRPQAVQDSTGQNILSAFVKDIEVPRRESFMSNWLTCNFTSQPCSSGVDVALTQF